MPYTNYLERNEFNFHNFVAVIKWGVLKEEIATDFSYQSRTVLVVVSKKITQRRLLDMTRLVFESISS